jgi:cytochrome c oxidase subunit 2
MEYGAMSATNQDPPKRIVIASANPLFGRGLEKLLRQRWENQALEIRIVNSMEDTLAALEQWQPELVIVDYDDRTIDRSEFLGHFMSGESSMQVMLVSLKASGAVVVYDRRTLSPAEMGDWFSHLSPSTPVEVPEFVLPRRDGVIKHYLIVGVLVIVFTFLTFALLMNINLLPAQASLEAQTVDRLFNMQFFAISFLFSLISVFLVYSIFVFRKRNGGSDEGLRVQGSNRLEIAWTIVPLAVVLFFSYYGSQNLAETRRVDPEAMVVEVIAGQWFWSYDYPEYGITSTTLNLPVDQQVLFQMTSRDVIHSFWVPEWRIKQDILPGENLVKEMRITPSETGEFKVLCAEMCGGAHAYMTSDVRVMEREEFDQWVTSQQAAAESDPVLLGQQLSDSNGCFACHTTDGIERIGPTWQGLYGSERQLVSGESLIADEEYLHTAIVDPDVHILEGYAPNIMPKNYEQVLEEGEINAIIEFIKSLE